jgi:hypothetical protein
MLWGGASARSARIGGGGKPRFEVVGQFGDFQRQPREVRADRQQLPPQKRPLWAARHVRRRGARLRDQVHSDRLCPPMGQMGGLPQPRHQPRRLDRHGQRLGRGLRDLQHPRELPGRRCCRTRRIGHLRQRHLPAVRDHTDPAWAQLQPQPDRTGHTAGSSATCHGDYLEDRQRRQRSHCAFDQLAQTTRTSEVRTLRRNGCVVSRVSPVRYLAHPLLTPSRPEAESRGDERD